MYIHTYFIHTCTVQCVEGTHVLMCTTCHIIYYILYIYYMWPHKHNNFIYCNMSHMWPHTADLGIKSIFSYTVQFNSTTRARTLTPSIFSVQVKWMANFLHVT